MIESTANKQTAKLMIRSRLPLIIPCVIIGTFAGIYFQTSRMNADLTLMYGIVAPIVMIVGFSAAFFGAKLNADKLVDITFQLNDHQLKKNDGENNVTIKLNEIKSSKLNMFGLEIKDHANSIFIPKQLDNFSHFKDLLM